MATFIIPVNSTNTDYTIDVALDIAKYRLHFMWNDRGGFWNMAICMPNNNIIQGGIKLVADTDLLARFSAPAIPRGTMFCLDMSGAGSDPGLTDLGTRCLLVYTDGY